MKGVILKRLRSDLNPASLGPAAQYLRLPSRALASFHLNTCFDNCSQLADSVL